MATALEGQLVAGHGPPSPSFPLGALGGAPEKEIPDEQEQAPRESISGATLAEDKDADVEAGAGPLSPSKGELVDFPEGGWMAWLQVLILWTTVGSSIGVCVNLFGIYVDYWNENDTFPGTSLLQLGFVMSTAVGISVIVGPFAGRFAERGHYRLVGTVGALLFLLGWTLSGSVTAVWQLYLTVGVLFGTGFSMLFTVAVVLPSHYFRRRRGLAVGLAITGTGVWGFAFGPLTSLMLSTIGWRWAFRVQGLVLGSLCTCAALLMRPRVPPDEAGAPFVDLRMFKKVGFWCLAVVQAFEGFCLYYYLPAIGTHYGATPQQSSFLVSILMIAGLVGRVVLGFAFDRWGHLNGFTGSYGLAIVCVLAWWPFATSYGSLAAFAAVVGVFFGGYVAMLLTSIADVLGTDGLATATAMVFFFGIFSQFLGAPMAGLLVDKNTSEDASGQKAVNYVPMMMWSGASMVPGLVALMYLRMREAGWKWARIV
ncbi:major facilitator superfamily domain-containing protein [Hyaloraphidium curvatum]|nr:major facilitator superfamily domain-containing protein [Hyaloraphidium curvatum]